MGSPTRGAARVALHALRLEIEAGLEARKTVAMIYRELEPRMTVPVSLWWFRVFVSREITGTAGSQGGHVPLRHVLSSTAPAAALSHPRVAKKRPPVTEAEIEAESKKLPPPPTWPFDADDAENPMMIEYRKQQEDARIAKETGRQLRDVMKERQDREQREWAESEEGRAAGV